LSSVNVLRVDAGDVLVPTSHRPTNNRRLEQMKY
jgi:hypothetical protein